MRYLANPSRSFLTGLCYATYCLVATNAMRLTDGMLNDALLAVAAVILAVTTIPYLLVGVWTMALTNGDLLTSSVAGAIAAFVVANLAHRMIAHAIAAWTSRYRRGNFKLHMTEEKIKPKRKMITYALIAAAALLALALVSSYFTGGSAPLANLCRGSENPLAKRYMNWALEENARFARNSMKPPRELQSGIELTAIARADEAVLFDYTITINFPSKDFESLRQVEEQMNRDINELATHKNGNPIKYVWQNGLPSTHRFSDEKGDEKFIVTVQGLR